MIKSLDNILYACHLKSGKSKQVTTGERTEGDLTYRVVSTTTTRKYAPSSPFDTYTETIEKLKLLPDKSRISGGSFDTEPVSRIVASSMRLKNGVTLQSGQSTPVEMRAQADLASTVSFHNHGDAIIFTLPRVETPPSDDSRKHSQPSPYTNRTFVYPSGKFIVSSDSHQHRGWCNDVQFADYHIDRSGKAKAEYYYPFIWHGAQVHPRADQLDATGQTAERHNYMFLRLASNAKGRGREEGGNLIFNFDRSKESSDRYYPAHCQGVTPPVSRRYFIELQ